MSDYIDLALKYGGFTSLDTAYLTQKLEGLSDQQKRDFITPPPSVINAYFAEIYQKQGPTEALNYYLELCQALDLFEGNPSFVERKPFIRLNLSGKSYGFTFRSADKAQVFAEKDDEITEALCFEIAQLFPDFLVSVENGIIILTKNTFIEEDGQEISLETALLTTVTSYRNGKLIKLESLNQEELLEVATKFKGKQFFGFKQRQAILYVLEIGKE